MDAMPGRLIALPPSDVQFGTFGPDPRRLTSREPRIRGALPAARAPRARRVSDRWERMRWNSHRWAKPRVLVFDVDPATWGPDALEAMRQHAEVWGSRQALIHGPGQVVSEVLPYGGPTGNAQVRFTYEPDRRTP